MPFSDQSYNLRIELDTKNFSLSAAEIDKMERDLHTLRKLVRDFPVSDLFITIFYHPRSNMYHVKTSLRLTGRTLFTGDHDTQFHPAYERCLRKLVHKVESYKHSLGSEPELKKETQGTLHEVIPTREPDAEAMQKAVDDYDYSAFWRAVAVYEEPVRKRAGRWIERYPQAAAQLGTSLSLDEIVEEVFLNAFERYERRPHVPLGTWLEELIDDSIRAFIENPDAERENVRFVQTLREAPRPE